MAKDHIPPQLYLQEVTEYETDTRRGNLLGIQPFMVPEDYASAQTFRTKVEGYLDAANQRGWLDEKTIVALPEHIGTWLVAAGKSQRVRQAETITGAMRMLVLGSPIAFAKGLMFARSKDRVTDGLFRVNAAQMTEIYQDVFSKLARKYAVTIVAGSILLPEPGVSDSKLRIGDDLLYNVCAVYGPDGTAHENLVRKIFPIETELPFTAGASAIELPVFDTPAGKLGVLICADSWYPGPYEILEARGADFVVVPSYLSPSGVWEQPWRGYNGALAPDDMDAQDAHTITEGEAWLKYALAGRLPKTGIKHGVNVFLRGDLWDLGSDGHTIVVKDRTVMQAKHITGAAMVNLWLS
jgi:hypothetical protein